MKIAVDRKTIIMYNIKAPFITVRSMCQLRRGKLFPLSSMSRRMKNFAGFY